MPREGHSGDPGHDPFDPEVEGEGDEGPPAAGASGEGGDVGIRGRATDFMRKALVAGVGALFMTEEGIRNLVGELKLPKELIGALLSQADRTKQEVVRMLGEELRRFFESAQLHQEILKLLTDVTIEIKTEVKLKPDGDSLRPTIVGEPKVQVHKGGRRKAR